MSGLFATFLIWFLISILIGLLIEGEHGTIATPYGIILCLPLFVVAAPFYTLFQIYKLIAKTPFHKFMSTPVKDLVKFSIKIERK